MLPQPQPPLRKNLRSVGGHVRGGRVVGAAYTATHTSSLQFSSGKGVGLVELRLGSRQRHGRRALYGLDYFPDPSHTLGEGEEEEWENF